MTSATFRPLVLIPAYNPGEKRLRQTLEEALAATAVPVWVVHDGSTDDSPQTANALAGKNPRLRCLFLPANQGKGGAVRHGALAARSSGYTHALVMDADGQHSADRIDAFLELAEKRPEAMVLGQPQFDRSVPAERLHGRKLSVWLVAAETMSKAVGDPLFGFRVYPIAELLSAMNAPRRCRRYNFDPEAAVRMAWSGVPAIQMPAPVKYLSKEAGGVSHFSYAKDNLRYIALHTTLLLQAPFRCARRHAKRTRPSL